MAKNNFFKTPFKQNIEEKLSANISRHWRLNKKYFILQVERTEFLTDLPTDWQ